MFRPSPHGGAIVHDDVTSGTTVLDGLNADHSCHSRPEQQIAAVCDGFARQRPVDLRISPGTRRKAFGIATCQMRLIGPVNRGNIDIVAKPHARFL
jgi:hypothetical protein